MVSPPPASVPTAIPLTNTLLPLWDTCPAPTPVTRMVRRSPATASLRVTTRAPPLSEAESLSLTVAAASISDGVACSVHAGAPEGKVTPGAALTACTITVVVTGRLVPPLPSVRYTRTLRRPSIGDAAALLKARRRSSACVAATVASPSRRTTSALPMVPGPVI